MIIAHVLSSFELGGQERVVVCLAREQRRARHRVIAIGFAGGVLARDLEVECASTHLLHKRARLDPSLPLLIASRLAREHVDVVHTHNPAALVYGATAGRLARIPVLHTKHGINPDPWRRRLLRRGAASLVDAYVAVTPRLADEARRQRECDERRLHVVENGVDTEHFRFRPIAREEIRASLGIGKDALVVGTVGRLSPEKDQALLLEAVAGETSWHVVAVGDGPERERLEARARRLPRPSRFHFVGTRTDVERWFSAFDVFALSSRSEGLPLVVLEAMSSERPVVATRVGGLADVVRAGETGLLSLPGEARELHDALAEVLRDPDRARRMGARARERVAERHSVRRMAERYAALYAELLRQQRLARLGLLAGAWSP